MRILLHTFILLMFTQSAYSDVEETFLEDINGNKHLLNEYIGNGKSVVVSVWATACPYCVHELYALSDFHERHKDKNAIVLGLTLDYPSFGYPDKEYLSDFALDYFIEYLLFMVDQKLATKVIGKPVNMIPLTFFYNPSGDLVFRLNGVVTEDMLEEVINKKYSSYQVEWAEEVPPEFKPD